MRIAPGVLTPAFEVLDDVTPESVPGVTSHRVAWATWSVWRGDGRLWRARCRRCGEVDLYRTAYLNYNQRRSCGCIRRVVGGRAAPVRRTQPVLRLGWTNGAVRLDSYDKRADIWRFVCACGRTVEVRGRQRAASTTTCGRHGGGDPVARARLGLLSDAARIAAVWPELGGRLPRPGDQRGDLRIVSARGSGRWLCEVGETTISLSAWDIVGLLETKKGRT